MDFNTYFNIAGVIILVTSPFPFETCNGRDFICEPADPDYQFHFEKVDHTAPFIEGAQFLQDQRWAHDYEDKEGRFIRAFLWKDIFYSEITVLGEKAGVCYYALPDVLSQKVKDGFELLTYMCMEKILIGFDALVLHSSHIASGGKGLAFSAPSQTGKSTQAGLWERYAGVSVLNGDRSILRLEESGWTISGCPMCGTSNIHRQGKESLTDIVMLSQSLDNQVERLSPAQAFHLIYPQLSIPVYDMAFMDRAVKLIDHLIQEIPIWSFACNMEEDAVWTLNRAIHFVE